MAEIEDYVTTIVFRDLSDHLKIKTGFFRRHEIEPIIVAAVEDSLAKYEAGGIVDTIALSAKLFDKFLSDKAIARTTDAIAGDYYRFSPTHVGNLRKKFLDSDQIYQRSVAIGDRFFPDVFAAYFGRYPEGFNAQIQVPAADRIVNLNHNQVAELEAPVEELVEQLERDNGIPDAPGTKERLLGQIKAGRELLRSGSFRAYLFYATILSALGELVTRYQGHAISMVAASLIDLLVKQALQGQ